GHRASTGFADANDAREDATRRALREAFRPEFLNRLDEVVVFKSLQPADLQQIAQMHVDAMVESVQRAGHNLYVSNEVVTFLATQDLAPAYGAREVRRSVERVLGDAAADALIDVSCEGAELLAELEVGARPAALRVSVQLREAVAD